MLAMMIPKKPARNVFLRPTRIMSVTGLLGLKPSSYGISKLVGLLRNPKSVPMLRRSRLFSRLLNSHDNRATANTTAATWATMRSVRTLRYQTMFASAPTSGGGGSRVV